MSWLSDFLDWLTRRHPPTPPAPPSPTPPGAIVDAINDARAARGLRPLGGNAALGASAARHVAWMDRNNRMDHYEPGNDWQTRARDAGYPGWQGVGECIAQGQRTAAEVVADWMSDPPHRAVLLGSYVVCGAAQSGLYWCADFGAV